MNKMMTLFICAVLLNVAGCQRPATPASMTPTGEKPTAAAATTALPAATVATPAATLPVSEPTPPVEVLAPAPTPEAVEPVAVPAVEVKSALPANTPAAVKIPIPPPPSIPVTPASPKVVSPPPAKVAASAGKVVVYNASFGRVSFDHAKHSAKEKCTSCHAGTPARFVLGKDKAHQLCKTCHQQKGGPTQCTGCHKK